MAIANPPDESVLESLMRSPRLAMWRAKIDAALDNEQRQRQHFYEVVTEHQKAEFINGEIVMHSPAKLKHTDIKDDLLTLIKTFVKNKERGFAGAEKMLVSLSRNDYEPDICYFGEIKSKEFTRDQMKFPPPDFVVEVLSPSTALVDRTTKFDDYAAHGVSEYWIIDPDVESVEQYGLKEGRYEMMIKARTGTITSIAVKGFEIPIRAIFDKDENLKALRAILA